MNSLNDHDLFNDHDDLDLGLGHNGHFNVHNLSNVNNGSYPDLLEQQQQLNDNQGSLADPDAFSFHSCPHNVMDPFHLNAPHNMEKNCIAGIGHSPELIHHLGHVEIRTPDTTDFFCTHMGDDTVCLERSFTMQSDGFPPTQDIQLMDVSSSNIAEFSKEASIVQNQILPMPSDQEILEANSPQNPKMSNLLNDSVLYSSKHQDHQDVSLLENVYLSHAIDYRPSRTCETNTIISHDGTIMANLQPMISHRLSYNEVSTTMIDDSFSHAISRAPSESPEKNEDGTPRRKVDPRIEIMFTMTPDELDLALRDLPEIDATGIKRLDVSDFDKLMKITHAEEQNFDPLIVEAISASKGKKASKATIFEYIISNYELGTDIKLVHTNFCTAMFAMLEKKAIHRKRGSGLRGLFEVSAEYLANMEAEKKKNEEQDCEPAEHHANEYEMQDVDQN